MFNIYSLSLENNKFYIGRTIIDPNIKLIQQENGVEWTKIYKPLRIIEQYASNDIFEEDILTKKYMLKYGIDNVRGGSYTKIKLDDWQIKLLNQEFQTANEICFNCNQTENMNVKKIYETILNLKKEITDLSLVTLEIMQKLNDFNITVTKPCLSRTIQEQEIQQLRQQLQKIQQEIQIENQQPKLLQLQIQREQIKILINQQEKKIQQELTQEHIQQKQLHQIKQQRLLQEEMQQIKNEVYLRQ
jgi:hypothetical protein